MLVKFNANLLRRNSFRVNAVAPIFIQINSSSDLKNIGRLLAKTKRLIAANQLMIMGDGTNCLIVESANCIFIKQAMTGITKIKEDPKYIWLEVGAGENWDTFVARTVKANWSGIENLSLIPGSVGASPVQNIGAYGVEVSERIEYVNGYCLERNKSLRMDADACEFGYRESVFKRKLQDEFLITSVCFRLEKQFTPVTNYTGVLEELSRMGSQEPSVSEVRKAIINIRQSKLPDPIDEPNAGSFFKNPIVSSEQYNSINQQYPNAPGYGGEQGIKIPAAWLIEKSKLKGYEGDRCKVSEKQPLVLVNHQNASGKQVLNLATHIQSEVFKKFGVQLDCEVKIINKP